MHNLLDEKWLPVLYNSGQYQRIGVKQAFFEAHQIRQLAANNPMDRMAALRFLLALLYWCQGNPPDKPVSSFPPEWFTKLEQTRDCFELLGDGKRFYQDRNAKRQRPTTDLIQEIPTGNNFWHFRHSTDSENGLCTGCCATGLLRLPMFSTVSLPDLKSGINGTPPIYVARWGGTLLETLNVNWIQHENIGVPSWEHHPVIHANEDIPLLTGLTLPARRVLLNDTATQGTCILCGATAPIIKECEFQSAGEQKNDRWTDPHVIYSTEQSREALKASDLIAVGPRKKKFSMDRPWPLLFKKMLESGWIVPHKNRMSLLIVGFAVDKAKNIDVWERIIELPKQDFEQELTAIMTQQWEEEGSKLKTLVARSKVQSVATVTAIRPHVENEISSCLEKLMGGNTESWQKATQKYEPMMKAVAQALSPGHTTAAIIQRHRIANTLPNMSQPQEAKDKLAKKGSGK